MCQRLASVTLFLYRLQPILPNDNLEPRRLLRGVAAIDDEF